MFSQKKRREYVLDNTKIMIDKFPKNIGKYLEIETKNPKKLLKIVDMLRLDKNKVEKRNYGEIIKDNQKGVSEEKKRVCIF
jgi:adenylate cyclase class IV